jgi:hypothetical protein
LNVGNKTKKNNKQKMIQWIYIIIGVLAVVLGVLAWFLFIRKNKPGPVRVNTPMRKAAVSPNWPKSVSTRNLDHVPIVRAAPINAPRAAPINAPRAAPINAPTRQQDRHNYTNVGYNSLDGKNYLPLNNQYMTMNTQEDSYKRFVPLAKNNSEGDHFSQSIVVETEQKIRELDRHARPERILLSDNEARRNGNLFRGDLNIQPNNTGFYQPLITDSSVTSKGIF